MAGFFLAFGLLMPGFQGDKGKSPRVKCTSCLKQVALAFELWKQDHESKSYPMAIRESSGGSKESVDNGRMVETFLTISDQLHTPLVLTCPGDKKRKPTESFAKLSTRNISYFLAADRNETNVNQILVGDRDLAVSSTQAISGVLRLTDPAAISWAGVIHGPDAGNVALIDGSAHQVTSYGLRNLLRCTSSVTNNRLLIP